MDYNKIANILFNMSLNIDCDSITAADAQKEIDFLTEELKTVSDSLQTVLYAISEDNAAEYYHLFF